MSIQYGDLAPLTIVRQPDNSYRACDDNHDPAPEYRDSFLDSCCGVGRTPEEAVIDWQERRYE